MRMVRVESGRPTRANSDARSGGGLFDHFVHWLFEGSWRLYQYSRGLADRRSSPYGSIDLACLAGKSPLDFGACRTARGGNSCASGQGYVPSVSAVWVRAFSPVLGLPNAAHHHDRSSKPSASPPSAWIVPGLEAAKQCSACRLTDPLGPVEDNNIRPHRPFLNGRKQVAAYLRTEMLRDEDVVLRAVLVDQQSRHLATRVVARGETQLVSFDPSRIIDEAFTAGAAGIIFVRGTRSDGDDRLSIQEVKRASLVWQSTARVGIHVLDYIVVTAGQAQALFAQSD